MLVIALFYQLFKTLCCIRLSNLFKRCLHSVTYLPKYYIILSTIGNLVKSPQIYFLEICNISLITYLARSLVFFHLMLSNYHLVEIEIHRCPLLVYSTLTQSKLEKWSGN